jgi:hypothetical protein
MKIAAPDPAGVPPRYRFRHRTNEETRCDEKERVEMPHHW